MSCDQAGVLNEIGQTNPSASQNNNQITINGFVGIGEPLQDASITIINATDPNNETIISTTDSDDAGYFSTIIDTTKNKEQYVLVATGGSYIDPITYIKTNNTSQVLSGIWTSQHIKNNESIYITPLSSLGLAFKKCLDENNILSSDPLNYSLATFNSLLETNHNSMDPFLSDFQNTTTNDTLHSLYNIAFAEMARTTKAKSAIDIVTIFSENLTDNCYLLMANEATSSSYSFYDESFRTDYLKALERLSNHSHLSNLTSDIDLSLLVENIRNKESLLFQYQEYP